MDVEMLSLFPMLPLICRPLTALASPSTCSPKILNSRKCYREKLMRFLETLTTSLWSTYSRCQTSTGASRNPSGIASPLITLSSFVYYGQATTPSDLCLDK